MPTGFARGLVASGPFIGQQIPAALLSLNNAFAAEMTTFIAEDAAGNGVDLSSCMREYLGLLAEIKGVVGGGKTND